MVIRTAILDDLKQILSLTKDFTTSFDVDDQKFQENYPVILQNENSKLLVAELDYKIMGYCLAFDHLALFSSGYITWIEELMVDENHRGKGLGCNLVEAIECHAKSKNSRYVALATRRSKDFYLKIGYEDSATYLRKLL